MGKTSTGIEVVQEGSLRGGREVAIRERVRELIELVLEEEVESALGAGRSQRAAERAGYRHGSKRRKLTLRAGTIPLDVPRARLVEADGGEREWQSRLLSGCSRSSAGESKPRRCCPPKVRCCGFSSASGSAARSSRAASKAIATSEARQELPLRRRELRDFSGKMRYTLFHRIRNTTRSFVPQSSRADQV